MPNEISCLLAGHFCRKTYCQKLQVILYCDCIENEKNGKLIKARNFNELKDAMESFIYTEANTMFEYSKESSFIINNKFSLDVIAEKYISLIE